MSNGSGPSLSVVIPVFNEQAHIEKCYQGLLAELPGFLNDFEIIFSNDGSTDQSFEILHRIANQDPRVKAFHSPQNGGLGCALRAGFALCEKDYIFYMDADLPFEFSNIRKAVNLTLGEPADVVLGFRKNRMDEGLKRMIYSYVYNLLIRILFAVRVTDINYSFKLIRRTVLNSLNLKSEGSLIDAEMVVKAFKKGARIREIEVPYHPRQAGMSHLSSLSTIRGIMGELCRYYREIKNYG